MSHEPEMGKINHLQIRKDAYVVRLLDWETRREITKRFTFSQFDGGKPAAYHAALSYRDQCLKLPQYQQRQRQKARKLERVELQHGVYLLLQGGGRKIFWQALKPGLPTKSFSVRTHGWEQAYLQAVAAYKSMTGVQWGKRTQIPPMPKRIERLLAKRWRRKRRKDAGKRNAAARKISIKRLRAKMRVKIKTLISARKRVTPYPHGRYDEVYFQGLAMMDGPALLLPAEEGEPAFKISRETTNSGDGSTKNTRPR